MYWKRAIVSVFLFALVLSVAPAAAQAQEPTAKVSGVAKTALGVPVPGATIRLTHTATGKAWVSWTDENGRFEVPGLPPGKYRIEGEMLGFQPASSEAEFGEKEHDAQLTFRIMALEAPVPAPTAPAPSQTPAQTPAQPPAGRPAGAPRQPAGNAPAPGSPGAPGARPGPNPQQAGQNPQQIAEALQRLQQQGGFQQVDPTRTAGAGTETGLTETPGGMGPTGGPLGEASSSDAFLISGTVGRGATAGGDMSFLGFGPGAFGPGGFGGGFAGQGGGFPGQGGGTGGGPGGMGGMDVGALIMMLPADAGGQRGGQQQGRGGQQGQGQQRGQGQQGQGQAQRGQQQQGQGQGGQQGRPGGQAGPQRGGFGDGMGGLMGMQRILRQQANRVRFSFYNRYGNSVWDARPYSLTEQDPAKVATYRERFGVSLGGPVYIPKVYNGRDKTFFFFNYDLQRGRNPVDTFATVPLAAERSGDFTARGLQLFDPNSSMTGPRTPLGSVIPSSMLDPAAVGLLPFIPLPNLSGTVQNFHLQRRVPQSADRFGGRVIHTINNKLNLQVSYNANWIRSESFQSFPDLQGLQDGLGQSASVGLTQQYSPRFSNDTRFMWNRQKSQTLNLYAFTNDIAGNLGITGISTLPLNYGVPAINYTNFNDLNDPLPALRRNQTFRLMDNVTVARQKHTLRAGVELRRQHNNNLNDPQARGQFTFTGAMTSDLDAQGVPVPGTGWDFADFLLGLPQSTSVRFGSTNTYLRSWALNIYAQDDWRIHPRFSVNFGLRYEMQTPFVELGDHLANLDMDATVTAVSVYIPGQTAPFSGVSARSLLAGDYNNWAPRLGFAWRPKLKRNTVVRAGYGLYYNGSIYNQLASQMANQPPHAQAQSRLTTVGRVLTLTNGFPAEPPGTVANTIGIDPNYRVGYAQIWNLSVETQVVRDVTATATYTGTKGTHLDLLRSPNRAVPGSPFDTELQRRIPNAPGFTWDTYGAASVYHAVQLDVRKRFTRGLMLAGTYTFGKSLDNASSIGGGAQVVVQDDTNFAAEKGLSAFDIRHQLRVMGMYELPFGERKRWARSGRMAAILGSWNMNGNVTFNTGTPYTARVLGSAANNSGTGNSFSERADQVGDPSLPSSQRTPLLFFNTAAFVLPPSTEFGDAARNTIPGPGTFLINFSMGKNIRFGRDGRTRMDLRWEVQNLFNTPNFTGLNTVVNSTNYGRVQGAGQMRTMDLNIRVNF